MTVGKRWWEKWTDEEAQEHVDRLIKEKIKKVEAYERAMKASIPSRSPGAVSRMPGDVYTSSLGPTWVSTTTSSAPIMSAGTVDEAAREMIEELNERVKNLEALVVALSQKLKLEGAE